MKYMPINILFVDDEPNTVNVVKLLIELDQPEWIFHAAYDGATALKIAQQTPLDFVLLDISMPGMDGIEVCKRLRQMPNAAQTAHRHADRAGYSTAARAIQSGRRDGFLGQTVQAHHLRQRHRQDHRGSPGVKRRDNLA